MSNIGNDTTVAQPRWKRAVFSLAAILLGLAPLLLLEGILAALDVGRSSVSDDPFVGFRSVQPLFVPDAGGSRYEIAQPRLTFFQPDSFAAQKGPREFRVFCLGGSTVQGRPYSIETSFTTWFELGLAAADPSREWQVVNCGGVSYASYRLVPVLREVLDYDPDLVILYTGQNEFLEDRTYRSVKEAPAGLATLYGYFSQLRTFRLLRSGYLKLTGEKMAATPPNRSLLKSEVDARLDYRGGLAQYHRDERWREGVIEHFRYNLQRMIQMCREAGVPIILLNPVSNWRDTPPFKSQHRDGLSAEQRADWQSLWDEAKEHYRSDLARAIALLRQAIAVDDQFAAVHYELAKCYDAMGLVHEARCAYLRAKELDVCPLRILAPMQDALLEVARETGTPLVDVQAMFERHSPRGIAGGNLLADHVHPSIHGHQLIAEALVETMVEAGHVLIRAPGWTSLRDRRYQAHLESLDEMYYVLGKQRLEGLRRWASGRVGRTRAAKPESH